jgi:predicted lipoprotein
MLRRASFKALIAAASVALTACVGQNDGSANTLDDFPFTSMLANYTDNIIIPAADDFSEQSALFATNSALDDYCEAIGSSDEAPHLSSAQGEWRSLMNTWQINELMILGPLAENESVIRNRILSYGSIFEHNACAVDQGVIAATEDGFSINSRRDSALGLDAIEYLLFNDDLDHSCPDTTQSTQNWNSLDDTTRKQQRCDYALLLADDLETQAQKLSDEWHSFRSDYLNPANTPESLSALSDALFYIEELVKDTKIGVPTSIINGDCEDAACPEDVESPYSETSLQNVRINLTTLSRLLDGGNGLGFDDVIATTDFANSGIIESLKTDINAAVSFIDGMDTSLHTAADAQLESGDETGCTNSAANPDTGSVPMCSLYGLLKRITDRLRIDFIAAVDLDLPVRSQSDND